MSILSIDGITCMVNEVIYDVFIKSAKILNILYVLSVLSYLIDAFFKIELFLAFTCVGCAAYILYMVERYMIALLIQSQSVRDRKLCMTYITIHTILQSGIYWILFTNILSSFIVIPLIGQYLCVRLFILLKYTIHIKLNTTDDIMGYVAYLLSIKYSSNSNSDVDEILLRYINILTFKLGWNEYQCNYVKFNNNMPFDQTKCAVCLESFTLNEVLTKLRCNHIFHHECLNLWMSEQYNCPTCKSM